MIEVKNKSNCCGCHACYSICPKNAITMVDDDKGFKYPKIDKKKCINCGLCEKVCPILKQIKKENEIIAYAAYNNNKEERLNSSSGGIFILLAKEIISKNGVVFGAAFNEDYIVEHVKIDKEEDLYKLMGSKYVQSNIKETYKEVKKCLLEKKRVLFTGTPCQIEGLKMFLMKDYENLYTQDIICHGVPSPLVWEKYKKFRQENDKTFPRKIFFRNKDQGWKLYNIKFVYNENTYIKNHNQDLFMKAFLKNTILRDSCYNCHFKKMNRISDITLADYWGVEKIHPELNDDKGISLLIINSEKGSDLFHKIKFGLSYVETDLEKAIKYNSSMIKSAKMDKNRNKFFANLNKLDFDILVKKYTYEPNMAQKIICKGKHICSIFLLNIIKRQEK